MRELAVAALLLLALAVGALAPIVWGDRPRSDALASGSPSAAPSWQGQDGGSGFVVCGSSDTWRRPTLTEQNGHLASDPGYGRLRADDSYSDAWMPFHASASVYDGSALGSRVDLIALTGVWSDPHIGATAAGCTSAEPQVWLVGYAPTKYLADDRFIATLQVAPAPGYRMVVLSGIIRPQLVVVSDVKLGFFTMPANAITPTPPPPPKPLPMPTPARTATAPRSPLVPIFPRTDRPLELTLPSTCTIESTGRHDDDLGATWPVQCGSATANLAVAGAAITQGWKLLDGTPPIGVGMQNYARNGLWMQIAYRLDGPAFADAFVIVQTLRPGAGANDLSPHDFAVGPACGIVDPPTTGQTAGVVVRKWLARCGDLARAVIRIEAWNVRSGWKFMSVVNDRYQTRRYCKGAFETLWHTGPDIGDGIVAITQTEGGCR